MQANLESIDAETHGSPTPRRDGAQRALEQGLVSAQAVRLHRAGYAMSKSGILGRADAEALATRHGALTEELVDVGLWKAFDLSFQINPTAT